MARKAVRKAERKDGRGKVRDSTHGPLTRSLQQPGIRARALGGAQDAMLSISIGKPGAAGAQSQRRDCLAVTSDGVTAGLDANQAEGHAALVPLLLIISLLHLLLLFRNYLDQIFHFFSKILLKSLI